MHTSARFHIDNVKYRSSNTGKVTKHRRNEEYTHYENTPIQIQSTLIISNSKGLYETLRDIRTSTYQICGTGENI